MRSDGWGWIDRVLYNVWFPFVHKHRAGILLSFVALTGLAVAALLLLFERDPTVWFDVHSRVIGASQIRFD